VNEFVKERQVRLLLVDRGWVRRDVGSIPIVVFGKQMVRVARPIKRHGDMAVGVIF